MQFSLHKALPCDPKGCLYCVAKGLQGKRSNGKGSAQDYTTVGQWSSHLSTCQSQGVSDPVDLGQGLRICISNKFPDAAATATEHI